MNRFFEWLGAKSIPQLKLFRDAKITFEQYFSALRTPYIMLTQEQYDAAARYPGLLDAESKFKAAIDMSRKEENYPNVATALCELGMMYHAQGRLKEAEAVLKESIEIFTNLPHPNNDNSASVSSCEFHLGIIAFRSGDSASAHTHLNKSMKIDESIGDYSGVQMTEHVITYIMHASAEDTNEEGRA